MIDIETQIRHWRDSSLEDMEVARILIAKNRIRHGLFWAHLTLEKMLKAHVCRKTGDLAPRIHNLIRLSELAGLEMQEDQNEFLGMVNEFNMEGRYGENPEEIPAMTKVQDILKQVEEMVGWLNRAL